ncbi:AraC family transcriptional regulator, partial [bacterium]
AFKRTCGTSPLRWLVAQRIDKAKVLLSHSDSSLEQVARSCGFSDTSHLGRAFAASEGVSPGVWRRAKRE